MDFEFEPMALILGGVGGLVTVIVMKQVQVAFFWKIAGFILGAAAGFFIASWRLNAD